MHLLNGDGKARKKGIVCEGKKNFLGVTSNWVTALIIAVIIRISRHGFYRNSRLMSGINTASLETY